MSNPYETPGAMNQKADSTGWFAETALQPDDAASLVEKYFLAEGYRFEGGNPHDAVYGLSLIHI